MDDPITAMTQAFQAYRADLEAYERKRKPTDGLLGFGRSLKDDACHDRFDERIEKAVSALCALPPDPQTAEQAVSMLLHGEGNQPWPLAAQWMLRAIERHTLPLIPFLNQATAAAFCKEYGHRYRPWDRLPVQKQVFSALKERGRT